MPALRIVLSLAFAVILVGAAPAEEKKATNKEKIVGVWEVTKAMPAELFPKIDALTFEFAKDGKVTLKMANMDNPIETGTYEVVGDTIKMPSEKPDKTMTIKTLTDKKLVVEFEKGGETATLEFKKK